MPRPSASRTKIASAAGRVVAEVATRGARRQRRAGSRTAPAARRERSGSGRSGCRHAPHQAEADQAGEGVAERDVYDRAGARDSAVRKAPAKQAASSQWKRRGGRSQTRMRGEGVGVGIGVSSSIQWRAALPRRRRRGSAALQGFNWFSSPHPGPLPAGEGSRTWGRAGCSRRSGRWRPRCGRRRSWRRS